MRLSHEENLPKGDMVAGGKYEFFVVNVRSGELKGTVSWNNEVSINVNGLKPGSISQKQVFSPKGGIPDTWQWSEKGRSFQLNAYGDDRLAAVVISDYGISVIVTSTSPDSWKW
nr:hypothetical protein [uncultured Psychroserpens sp.]|tara:strand:+ start:527 stop:868 length:342 start_codon:yes stop_codon:yes gene_type:complete